jgi:hypothetical protein
MITDEEATHQELAKFGPEIVAVITSTGFFDLEGPYDPSEVKVSPRAKARYVAASQQKNSRVWDLVKFAFIPTGLLQGARKTAAAYSLPAPKTAKDWMDEYIKDHGGEYIGRKKIYDGVFVENLTKADKNAIARFMWANAGKNERPLARQILRSEPQLAYLVDNKGYRLRNIKRTEVGRTVNYGGQQFAKQYFKDNTWHTAGDNRVRDAHKTNAGRTVKIGDPFPNGERYPAESSIGCRCHLSYS